MNKGKKTVLFICTHNSASSQMTEGILNALYHDTYQAFSAGVSPSHVSPYAVEVLKEIGIDISDNRSKSIKEFQGSQFDYVITVCDNAKETCPFFPGKKILHKGFTDPANVNGSIDEILGTFRRVRDEIIAWIKKEFRD